MKIKQPAAARETPEEAARRQAEESRIASAQAVADRQAVTGAQKISAQRTRRVFRLFGANSGGTMTGGGSISDQVKATTNSTTGAIVLNEQPY